jgi:hypothetical protein
MFTYVPLISEVMIGGVSDAYVVPSLGAAKIINLRMASA